MPISICIDHECWLPNCCPVPCISQISLTGHSKVFLVKSGLLQVSVQELSRFYCSTVHYLNALFNNAQWPLITCLESDSWNIMHWRTKDNQQKTDALEVYALIVLPWQRPCKLLVYFGSFKLFYFGYKIRQIAGLEFTCLDLFKCCDI